MAKKAKKSNSKTKLRNKVEDRINLLKERGFRFDAYEGKWVFNEHFIPESLVFNLTIPFAVFEIIVYLMNPPKTIEYDYEWWLANSPRSSINSILPYLDALDFRLPGSYGTGKRN